MDSFLLQKKIRVEILINLTLSATYTNGIDKNIEGCYKQEIIA